MFSEIAFVRQELLFAYIQQSDILEEDEVLFPMSQQRYPQEQRIAL